MRAIIVSDAGPGRKSNTLYRRNECGITYAAARGQPSWIYESVISRETAAGRTLTPPFYRARRPGAYAMHLNQQTHFDSGADHRRSLGPTSSDNAQSHKPPPRSTWRAHTQFTHSSPVWATPLFGRSVARTLTHHHRTNTRTQTREHARTPTHDDATDAQPAERFFAVYPLLAAVPSSVSSRRACTLTLWPLSGGGTQNPRRARALALAQSPSYPPSHLHDHPITSSFNARAQYRSFFDRQFSFFTRRKVPCTDDQLLIGGVDEPLACVRTPAIARRRAIC